MANGIYGTKRPANITADDVDIFYFYQPSRDADSPNFYNFKKLDDDKVASMFNQAMVEGETSGDNPTVLPGMYNLRLPMDDFGEVGIYSIYIKPKAIKTEIKGSGILNNSNVRGIIFNESDLDISVSNNSLTGYMVDYGGGEFRIITSNNRCIPVVQNDGVTVRYTFSDTSNLIFCTVTPSTAMSFNAGALPYIGNTGDQVVLSNTKFNPIMIELEVTEHDIETISTMLEGSQIRNLDRGIITTFDKDGNIYHQAAYGNIRKQGEGGIYHDFKEKLDANQIIEEEKDNFDKIIENI